MLTMEEFNQLFTGLQHSAWRLLTLDGYNATEQERARVAEWRRSGQVPDRSGDAWIQMVGRYRKAGVPFARTHIFPGRRHLPEYCEYVLGSYEANDAAGERVSIADRDLHPVLAEVKTDFWVLDDAVVVLEYDDARRYLGAHFAVGEEADLCRAQQALAQRWCVPLAQYKADRRGRLTA